jgi:hypothetical protein
MEANMPLILELPALWKKTKQVMLARTLYIEDYCRSHGMPFSTKYPQRLFDDETYQELDKAAKEARTTYMQAKYSGEDANG